MKVLDLPFTRPIAVVILFSLAALIGVYEYTTMKYELTPPMALSSITVQTVYPGASPQEVEEQVTKKIEDAVSGVAHVRHVTSQSVENASVVAIEFDAGADMASATQDVQRVVNAKMGDLPTSVKTPSVNKLSFDDSPIIQLAVTAKGDKGSLYQLVKDTVKPRLNRIGGVGQVSMLGGNAREIKVSLSQSKLEQYGVPILLVLQKIGAANLDFPAGSIKADDGQFVVRIAGKLKNLDEMRSLVLANGPNSGSVRLGDVARIEDSLADSETIFRYNGKEAIGVMILKQAGSNAVEVSKAVHSELASMEREFRQSGLKFEIADDSSVFTLGSAHDVVTDIIIAIILVGVIMILFLHDLRNAFVVMMAIPATLLSTFICMGLQNFTLNLMSLLAMTLVIGILVDDSIVVIENIHRHKALGKSSVEAARFGTREIAFAAVSVTLVIIVSFLPMSFTGGIIGSMLLQFGLTLVMATGISLIVSFFLTPLLASKIGDAEEKKAAGPMRKFGDAFDRAFSKITDAFLVALAWSFRRKKLTVLAAIALFALGIGLVATGIVGSELATEVDRGLFNVSLELPERTTLAENDRVVHQVEDILRSMPEVRSVYTKVGYDSTSGSSNYKTSISVGLVPRDQRKKKSVTVGMEVEKAVRKIPGIKVKVAQAGLFDMGASATPVMYDIVGSDYASTLKVANEWATVMRAVKGTGEVTISVSNGKPELQVDIDRTKLADLGLSLDSVGSSLRTALAGNDSLLYHEDGKDYAIRVELDSFDRTNTDQVGNLTFTNNQGRQIRLSQFATIKNAFGPTVLQRLDRQTCITVSGQNIGRPSGDIDQEIRAKSKGISIPSDIAVRPSGVLSTQGDAFGSLGFALILSIILIYSILAILFNSLSYPLPVMFSLPFALVGGFIALAVGRQTLNIFSIMSMILLMGLAAKNAILLVDRALHNRSERHMDNKAAFTEAVATRIKPIFMTTLAMVFGMLSIALGLGSAGELKQAMGVVLIGGLLFSLLVTMILVPVSFLCVDQIREKAMKKKNGIKEKPVCA